MSVTAGVLFFSQVVDIYHSASGIWTTAQLSVARSQLAAASVGNMAIFAGGITGVLWRVCVGVVVRQ
jgi:uncharacterized protein YkvS